MTKLSRQKFNLTPRVLGHITRLFPGEVQEEVALLLEYDCGQTLAGAGAVSPETFERVQCAALKWSDGKLDKLYDAVALAQTDWRDLLVIAGFAEGCRCTQEVGWINTSMPRLTGSKSAAQETGRSAGACN